MSAIFSVQNLQTFLRRKNLRPPSRGGPPGPERPPPPNRGRSPDGLNPSRGPSPAGRSGRSLGAFVSSGITLLKISYLVPSCQYLATQIPRGPQRFLQ